MTHYDEIYETAADNYGLITSKEAKKLGISDKEMSALAKRGLLTKRGHGVYRLSRYIPTPYDVYAEAVALVGSNAYLYAESVLAMLELAPTNPTRIFVATPARIRKTTLPSHIVVVKANDEVAHYEGIPSQKIKDAIGSSQSTMIPKRLIEATSEARRQGYITEVQKNELLKLLGDI